MAEEDFDALAEALGVADHYVHVDGHRVAIPGAVRRRLIEAQGYPADTQEAVADSLARVVRDAWRPGLPPVAVAGEGDPAPGVTVILPVEGRPRDLHVQLTGEDGRARRWSVPTATLERGERRPVDGRCLIRHRLPLPDDLAPGYYRLLLDGPWPGREGRAEALLIRAPRRCWRPAAWEGDGRCWGFAVQLYALPAASGHGDFAGLRALVDQSRELGAGFVGTNPLHALFGEVPARCSPYSPNSRTFLNPLYIAAGDAGTDVPAGAFVDHAAARAARMPALEARFRAERDSPDFARFIEEGGERLKLFGLFEALREAMAFSGPDGHWRPWHHWPEDYHRPESPAVARFAAEHPERVLFHQWLQYAADRQLGEAAAAARDLGIGLYADLAVGFDRDGFDAWVDQDAMPGGVAVGCPPDRRNPLGQDWGVATYAPAALRAADYGPFIAVLRANMKHASVLRIDHAFQFARQYWVPLGSRGDAGGYVAYPMDEMLAVLALESHRQRCAVVAEDLGTIPEGFRERMMDLGALSFRVLHREREADRSYRRPAAYPEEAAVTPGTHDHATLAGFWTGRDVQVRTELDLYPTAEAAAAAPEERKADRRQLLAALADELGFDGPAEDAEGRPSEDLLLAVYRYLARTPAKMLIANLEDLFGQLDQVNLPGTLDDHPNWCRRLPTAAADLPGQPVARALARVMAEENRSADQDGEGE